MSNKSASIRLTKAQIEYLVHKTGASDPQEAFEIFAIIIRSENIDPSKMPEYLKKLMAKDGIK